MNPKYTFYKLLAFVLLGAAVGLFYYGGSTKTASGELTQSPWLCIVLPLAMFVYGFLALMGLLYEVNIYGLTSGEVINQRFIRRHYLGTKWKVINRPLIAVPTPGGWVPACWAIEIKDVATGHTGWLHFDHDVFATYPVGSHYDSTRHWQQPAARA